MQLTAGNGFGAPRDPREAGRVLRRAVERGVNLVDTADAYGPFLVEEMIATSLHPYPDDLVIVSKVGAVRDAQGGWPPAQHPAQLRAGVEDNLRTLEVDRLGAVNLRLLDHDVPEQDRAPLEDQLAEMAALRDEGKIAGIGISTATLDQVRQAHETVGLACVQNAFSLLDQSDRPVLDYCLANEIAYVPYFPLGSAFPHLPKVTDDPTVQAIAGEKDATPAQVGLAWLLALAPNLCVIPGTSSLAHLEENLAVAEVTLESDDLERLSAIG
jgi:aryl-alcohol dehydrogenase-like predicted oxidoreductase